MSSPMALGVVTWSGKHARDIFFPHRLGNIVQRLKPPTLAKVSHEMYVLYLGYFDHLISTQSFWNVLKNITTHESWRPMEFRIPAPDDGCVIQSNRPKKSRNPKT